MGRIRANKWVKLSVLILGGGTIFKLISLKDAFYIPMMTHFHLTNEQIGISMSVYGIVQTVGYIPSMYLSDRFSKKILIPMSLICVGLVGLYFSTFPSFIGILLCFALFAVFAEMTYWPVLLKTVRLLGTKEEQGRMFGFLEGGRGVVDTFVAFSALGIFLYLGSGALGLRYAIYFYSGITILVGILSIFFIDGKEVNAKIKKSKDENKEVLKGIISCLKIPEIWLISFIIFFVYMAYCGLTSFIPFLRTIYGLPLALVGAYGIVNQYGLKLIGGPVGGFLADKVFHSPLKCLRLVLLLGSLAMIGFIFLPHEHFNAYIGMIVTLCFGTFVFVMRAIFFAPMEEVNIPKNVAGTAMAIACFVGYAPNMFAYTLFGRFLDKNPGISGYNYVFVVMGVSLFIGFILSCVLLKRINKIKITY